MKNFTGYKCSLCGAEYLQGQVTYTRHDGSQLSVPFANIFKLRDGLIGEYRIFGDFSALAG